MFTSEDQRLCLNGRASRTLRKVHGENLPTCLPGPNDATLYPGDFIIFIYFASKGWNGREFRKNGNQNKKVHRCGLHFSWFTILENHRSFEISIFMSKEAPFEVKLLRFWLKEMVSCLAKEW